MSKLMKLLNQALSSLPLDGDKTKIGVLLLLYATLKYFYPELSLQDIGGFLTDNLTAPGLLVAVGFIHKQLKKYFPTEKQAAQAAVVEVVKGAEQLAQRNQAWGGSVEN